MNRNDDVGVQCRSDEVREDANATMATTRTQRAPVKTIRGRNLTLEAKA